VSLSLFGNSPNLKRHEFAGVRQANKSHAQSFDDAVVVAHNVLPVAPVYNSVNIGK
jgi:hypothetical protein